MVQLVLDPSELTLTSESSFAFASYSNVLCTIGLRERSRRFDRIAMALVEKFDGKYSSEVILSLSISIRPYTQPLQACLASLEASSLDCTKVGDLSTAFLCKAFGAAIMHIFASVDTLQSAFTKLQQSLEELTAHGHPMFIMPMIQLQSCLNLTSSNNNAEPTMLRGAATNEEDIMSVLPPSHPFYGRLKRKADFMRLYLGYLFRRNDIVMEMALSVEKNRASTKFYPSFESLLENFYLGLAGYSIVRHGGGHDSGGTGSGAKDWLAIADKMTKEMEHLAENDSAWNFKNKFYLLAAEQVYTKGDVEEAATAYDRAVETAKEHRFLNEQALASERAALFHLDQENVGKARTYLEQSKDLYQAWGAYRKVEDILSLLVSF